MITCMLLKRLKVLLQNVETVTVCTPASRTIMLNFYRHLRAALPGLKTITMERGNGVRIVVPVKGRV